MTSAPLLSEARIKDLTPGHFIEPRSREFRTNLRNHGSFRLKLRRPSRSPSFSRPYMPQDPLHLIDWKIFARTDQLIVREEYDESAARVLIVLDLSSSMHWPTQKLALAAMTKAEIGLRVGLNLAFIHLRMADQVRFLLWPEGSAFPDRRLEIRTGSDTLTMAHRLFEGITAGSPTSEMIFAESLPCEDDARRYDVVYFLSDGLSNNLPQGMKERTRRVHFLHTLSHFETASEWLMDTNCYFDDPAVGTENRSPLAISRREYLGESLRFHQAFDLAVAKWRDRLKRDTLSQGHVYQLITDETPIREYQEGLLRNLRRSGGAIP